MPALQSKAKAKNTPPSVNLSAAECERSRKSRRFREILKSQCGLPKRGTKLKKEPRDTRTKEQLLDEIDRLRNGSIIEEVGQSVRFLTAAACIGFVTWCMKESVISLAGQETNANIVVNFLGRIQVAAALSATFGAGGLLYGISQRSLRKRTVRKLHARIQQYEKGVNPNRTSSMLTPTGDTNPEDL